MACDILFVRIAPYIEILAPHPQNVVIPYIALQTATMLKQLRYQVRIIDTWGEAYTKERLEREIMAANPQVLVVKSTSTTVDFCLELIRTVKVRKNIFSIAYGQHASVLPESFLSERGFDLCVIGEAEQTLVEVIDQYMNQRDYTSVPGICYLKSAQQPVYSSPRPLFRDLDQLPMMDYSLLNDFDKYKMISCWAPHFLKKIRWGFAQTSRGCPYHCIYCSPALRVTFGKEMRFHSPEYVLENINLLHKDYRVDAVALIDDIFTVKRAHAEQIARLILREKLPIKWITQTRADRVDRELLRLMADSGCTTICVGIESGSDRVLQRINKGEDTETMRKGVKMMHAAGIETVLSFMVGHPEETMEDFQKTVDLACELNSQMILVMYLTPYPGSQLCQTISENHIDYSRMSHYNFHVFNYSNIPMEQFVRLQRSFYAKYYLRPAYIWKYMRKRLPLLLYNGEVEYYLLKNACRFFQVTGKRRVTD